MSADEPPEPPAENGDSAPQGVFGNLPHRRPGARSPRRQAGRDDPGVAGPRDGAAEPTSAEAAPEPESAPSHAGPEADPPASEATPAGGLEDVAWAGVAAAAEAATIGVRLATRALEAMRDAVDRR
jgi:hypothetical protein